MVHFCFLRYGRQERLDRILQKIFPVVLPGTASTSLLTAEFDEQGGKYFLKLGRIPDAAEKRERQSTSDAKNPFMDMR